MPEDDAQPETPHKHQEALAQEDIPVPAVELTVTIPVLVPAEATPPGVRLPSHWQHDHHLSFHPKKCLHAECRLPAVDMPTFRQH